MMSQTVLRWVWFGIRTLNFLQSGNAFYRSSEEQNSNLDSYCYCCCTEVHSFSTLVSSHLCLASFYFVGSNIHVHSHVLDIAMLCRNHTKIKIRQHYSYTKWVNRSAWHWNIVFLIGAVELLVFFRVEYLIVEPTCKDRKLCLVPFCTWRYLD